MYFLLYQIIKNITVDSVMSLTRRSTIYSNICFRNKQQIQMDLDKLVTICSKILLDQIRINTFRWIIKADNRALLKNIRIRNIFNTNKQRYLKVNTTERYDIVPLWFFCSRTKRSILLLTDSDDKIKRRSFSITKHNNGHP